MSVVVRVKATEECWPDASPNFLNVSLHLTSGLYSRRTGPFASNGLGHPTLSNRLGQRRGSGFESVVLLCKHKGRGVTDGSVSK